MMMTETYEPMSAEDGVVIEPAVPIFRIFSVEKAMEFYRDFLGFTVDWEHRFAPGMPLYCQVSRSGMLLHLSEHAGDASPGARVFVPMRGVKALHAELTAKNYPYMRPGLDQAPWGLEVAVTDPFSNRITFCEREIKPEA
jgi:catechol 2,3-dioxygenase-like lactoylglutathione lyase family enzyme